MSQGEPDSPRPRKDTVESFSEDASPVALSPFGQNPRKGKSAVARLRDAVMSDSFKAKNRTSMTPHGMTCGSVPHGSDMYPRAQWRVGESTSELISKALSDLMCMFAAADPPPCTGCSCSCHNGEDNPERLVFQLLRSATLLTCRVPQTKDVGVQNCATMRDSSHDTVTNTDLRHHMRILEDACVQATPTTASAVTTTNTGMRSVDSACQHDELVVAEEGMQTDEKSVFSRGIQTNDKKLQAKESGVQCEAEKCDRGVQLPVAELKQSSTQLGVEEMFARLQSGRRGTLVRSLIPGSVKVQARSSDRNGDSDSIDFSDEEKSKDSSSLSATTSVKFEDVESRRRSNIDIASPLRQESPPTVREEEALDDESMHVDFSQIATEPMFKTVNAEVQASNITCNAGTNTTVAVRRVACQTDSCFVIGKRARTPVRIGGGYHVLPRSPRSGSPARDRGEGSPRSSRDSGSGLSDGDCSDDEHNRSRLRPPNANSAIYGQPLQAGGRFAHGAAGVASDIERFLVGAYNMPTGPEEGGLSPRGIIDAEMSHQLLSMYRVLRPKRQQPQQPEPQQPVRRPLTAGRRPNARPRSAHAGTAAHYASGGLAGAAAAAAGGLASGSAAAGGTPVAPSRAPGLQQTLLAYAPPVAPTAVDGAPSDVAHSNIDGFTKGWARNLRGG